MITKLQLELQNHAQQAKPLSSMGRCACLEVSTTLHLGYVADLRVLLCEMAGT